MDNRLINRRPLLVLAVASLLLLTAAPLVMADFEKIDLHGFASQGFMESTDYNYLTPSLKGSWAMSEYAINVGSDLSDDLRIGVQFFGRNLGDLGNNEVGVDWAFGDYHRYSWLGLRAGRVKMPYGLYNETADFDHVRTSVLMPQSVYDVRMRDFRTAINGINPYGNLDLDAAGTLEYSAVLGYISHPKNGSLAKFMGEIPFMSYGGSDNDRTVIGQLIWNTPIQGLRVAHTYDTFRGSVTLNLDPMFAMMIGLDPVQTLYDDTVINTSSVEYSYGNVMLAGEYNTWRMKMESDNPMGMDMDWENWYAQASYRLNPWFEIGSYYAEHYDDKKDRKGENYDPDFRAWQKDLALSLRFDFSNNMIFKLEGHRMDGVSSVFTQDNEHMVLYPSTMEQNWYMFASKVSFVF